MKWDLSQFDIESSQWVKEAFESKKYAFAADYIRLYAIYTYGGIYLDSDISLNDSLDVFIDNEAFSVIEYHPDLARKSEMDRKIDELGHRLSQFQSEDFPLGVQAAIIGSEKRNPIIRELMNYYEGKNFINQDGSLNINPIAPGIYTRILENHGFVFRDILQRLPNFTLYPSSFIASTAALAQSGNIGVHNCQHSWDTAKTPMLGLRIWRKLKSFFVNGR